MYDKYCLGCKKKIIPKTRKGKNPKYCSSCTPVKESEINMERHKRKEELVKMLGGKCVKCGYNKSLKALTFHHIDPSTKRFDIANGHILKEWDIVVEEAKKCDLLCLNCHTELNEKLLKK